MCPMCGDAKETIRHMLFECVEVSDIWKYSPLRLDVTELGSQTLEDWLIVLDSRRLECHWWSLFWSVAWGIWLRRNQWCFEKKKIRWTLVVERAVALVEEYAKGNCMVREGADRLPPISVWTPPLAGVLKLNTDAAFIGGMLVGVGAVVRDFEGDVLMSMCRRFSIPCEVNVGEAMAVREAVKVALEAGFRSLTIETDSLQVYHHLKNCLVANNYFGSLIKDILVYARQCRFISFSHVKRDGNKVAHELAHLSSHFDVLRIWLEDYPPQISALVNSDALIN